MIDPSVALNVRPVVIPDAAKQFAESQGLAQQRALRNQQLQEGDIALQERQKALKAQDTLTGLLKANSTVTPDGELQVNHAAVAKGLVDASFGPEAIAYNSKVNADLKAALERQEAQVKVNGQKAARLGSLAGSVPKVDWNAPDAADQAAKAQASLKQSLDTAVAEKLIDPAHAQQILAQPYSPQTEQQVQQFGNQAMTSAEQHTAHLADYEEIRKQADAQIKKAQEDRAKQLFPSQLTEQENKVKTQQTAEDAKMLADAAKQGPDALAAGLQRLSEQGRVEPFMGVTAASKPNDILRVAMAPHEIMSADISEKNAENNVSEYELELRAAKGDAAAKTALANRQKDKIAAAVASRDPNVAALRSTAQLDHEINQYGKPYEDMTKAQDAQLEKILEAEKLVAGGSVSQAMAIPKLLQSIMASGQAAGTGVRSTINNAEMERIEKARGLVGGVEGFFNRISGNGSLTADQKKQMNGILSDVRERIIQKKMVAKQAGDEMRAATKREDILAADKKARESLDAHQAQGSPASLSTGHKVGDIVTVGNKKYTVTKVLPNDKFEADEVKQ